MLTSSKKRVLDFINSYTKKREVSPSLEDIRKGLRLKSVSTIHQHVKELEEHGYLRKESKRHRSIEISTRKDMVQVPLLGTIAAGQPIEAIEISDETITIAKDEIGTLLHHAIRERENGRRPYPSGGALYPIETYLIARGIAGIPDGAHHYHPRAHAFEYLWSVPESSHILRPGSGSLVESSPAIIVLTALWNRNYGKYSDFAYYLGLIESGHAAQNILLSAAALKIPARPIAGFDDAGITKLLDLDQHTEQPVYVISIGT